jgi:hypothetical protein
MVVYFVSTRPFLSKMKKVGRKEFKLERLKCTQLLSMITSRDNDRAALSFRFRSSAAFCPHSESTTPSLKSKFRNPSFSYI